MLHTLVTFLVKYPPRRAGQRQNNAAPTRDSLLMIPLQYGSVIARGEYVTLGAMVLPLYENRQSTKRFCPIFVPKTGRF